LIEQRHPAGSVQSLQEIDIFHESYFCKPVQFLKNRPSHKNPLVAVVEISKFESGKESNKPEEKSRAVKSQQKCAARNPGIGQSPFQ
jgi:hypothetical protein